MKSCPVGELPGIRCGCLSHNGFLTRRGYEVAAEADGSYLDKVGSVSALVEVEDDFEYDLRHIELNELRVGRQLSLSL